MLSLEAEKQGKHAALCTALIQCCTGVSCQLDKEKKTFRLEKSSTSGFIHRQHNSLWYEGTLRGKKPTRTINN